MDRGIYIGPQEVLKRKTALLRPSTLSRDLVEAQFDDLSLGLGFTHTWLYFPKDQFSAADLDDDI